MAYFLFFVVFGSRRRMDELAEGLVLDAV